MTNIELFYFINRYKLNSDEINHLHDLIKENNLEHVYKQSINAVKSELNGFLNGSNIIITNEEYRSLTLKFTALNSILKEYPNLFDNVDKEKFKNELYNLLNK